MGFSFSKPHFKRRVSLMEKFDRIVQVLSLVSSDRRKETIKEFILYILYALGDRCDIDNIQDFIESEFSIKLFEEDLIEGLGALIDDGKIQTADYNTYAIDPEITEDIKWHQKEVQERADFLYVDFCFQIDGLSNRSISEDGKLRLYKIFQEYVYECIYLFGKESVSLFKVSNETIQDLRVKVLRSSIRKITEKNEAEVLKAYIKSFPDNLTSTQVDFIEHLVSKAEDFYSLGLSNDQAEDLKNFSLLNWIIFLDTNVLYSILDLHDHPENEACQKIVQIVNSNSDLLNIKFMFLQRTHEELLKRRAFFEDTIPRHTYKQSNIKMMLRRENLDSFTASYLQKMMKFGSDTPHPVELIDRHITILKNKNIEINKRDLSAIDTNSETFLQLISDYKKAESIFNEAKAERGLPFRGPKDLDNVEHDIFFREAIRRLRINKPVSLSESKYFGLTLDAYLIKFDNYQLRKEPKTADLLIPTFFKPSFLLSKLLRLLPVKTEDYKRAFVKSISTPTLRKNKPDTVNTLQTVARFNALGLYDNAVILDCLTDEIFLTKYRKLEEQQDFQGIKEIVEGKYEKRISETEIEKKQLEAKLTQTELAAATAEARTKKDSADIQTLERKLEITTEDLRIFRQEIEKIKQKKPASLQATTQLSLLDSEKIDINDGMHHQSKERQPNDAPQRIVNWELLHLAIKTMSERVGNFLIKVITIVNISFGIFFLILGCVDFKNSSAFLALPVVDTILLALLNKMKSLRYRIVGKLFCQIFLAALFLLVIKINWNEIKPTLQKIEYSISLEKRK
jgi:hypothetical protein